MPAFKDLSGRRFGRVTAERRVENRGKHTYWMCHCDCGKAKEICAYNLTAGLTKSCGCLSAELIGDRSRTHGMTNSKAYTIWSSMKARCLNPKDSAYAFYGARGITVCESWANSFESFLADMGEPPAGKSIDRIDVDGDYCPENCKWASASEQANNKTNNRFLTFEGVTMTAAQWARKTGIKAHTILRRLRDGWTVERALTTKPFAGRNQYHA